MFITLNFPKLTPARLPNIRLKISYSVVFAGTLKRTFWPQFVTLAAFAAQCTLTIVCRCCCSWLLLSHPSSTAVVAKDKLTIFDEQQQRCDSHFLSYIRKWWLRLWFWCRGVFVRDKPPATQHQGVVVGAELRQIGGTCCNIVVLSRIMFPNPNNDIARIAHKRRSAQCGAHGWAP